jgi:CheY-like chemotaxis protein
MPATLLESIKESVMSTSAICADSAQADYDLDDIAPSAQGNPTLGMEAIRIPSVLIIEDNPGDVELTMLAFQARGLIVDFQVAVNGGKALEYLESLATSESRRPDLILLDLNLPMITGRDILSYIKRDPDLCNIPTVVLTSSHAQRDSEQCSALGADAFLVKPMTLQELLDMMKEIEPILKI